MTVIFDLDGTLADSVEDLGDSVNTALKEHGFSQHTYEEYRSFVGNGIKLLIRRAVPPQIRDTQLEIEIFERFSAVYEETCLNKTRPYNGITECLDGLRRSGARLAVASNKADAFSQKIVYALFGDDVFDAVAGNRDGVPRKPQPDIIENLLSELSSQKSDCVLVGDSEVDVETARNAGIACIGCTWGFRGRERLESAGCKIIIDSPYELEQAIYDVLEQRESQGGSGYAAV